MNVLNMESLHDVYNFIKEINNIHNTNIIFSRQNEYSLINLKKNNELKVSYNHKSPYINSNSYVWLESIIKYKPIWSFIFNNEMNFNFKEFESAFEFGGGQGEYVFIATIPDNSIKTSFYNWVDVHYLLNDGSEEELESERYKINLNYILDIDKNDRIQVLSEHISKKDIIAIIKLTNLK